MNLESMLDGVSPWLAALPLVVGLLFLGSGVRTFSQSRRRRQTWTRRTGLVVGSRLSDGQVRSQVTFSDEQGPVTFWNRYTTTFSKDSTGQSVEVLVSPLDRSDAIVADGAAGPGFVAGAFVAFGLLAVAVGVVLFIVTVH